MFKTFKSEEELIIYINRPEDDYSYYGNGKFDFEDCTFEFEVDFQLIQKKFNDPVVFKDARFEKKVYFENVIFESKVTFEKCYFQKSVSFKKATFKESVEFYYFSTNVDFEGVKFLSTTTFPKYYPNSINLSHCRFEETLDLSSSRFEKELNLNDSVFIKNVSFQSSIFNKKVNAWNTIYKKNLSFRWANFREKINLTDSYVKKGKTDFFGTNFENNAYFYNTEFKIIDLKNSVIEEGVYFLGSTIQKCNRETNRIIKNQFAKQNNRIESLKFHHREMSSYFQELLYESFLNLKNFKLWKLLKNFGDLIILSLNFLSNGFGLWWFAGIIFLFTTTSVIYDYYLVSINLKIPYDQLEYWKYYVQFIVPTHKFDFIDGVILTDKSYIIDYFGRVISAFGIYQTVQAFRKFGKI